MEPHTSDPLSSALRDLNIKVDFDAMYKFLPDNIRTPAERLSTVLVRMAQTESVAVVATYADLVAGGKFSDAYKLISDNMTIADLANEKEALANEALRLAVDKYETDKASRELLSAVLNTVITIALVAIKLPK